MLLMRKSLRFKLALWFGLLYTISSLLVFIIFYHFLKTTIQDKVDQQLKSKMVRLISKYDHGSDINNNDEKHDEDLIPFKNIPQLIIDSYQSRVDHFVFKKCKFTTVDGQKVYKIVGTSGESIYEIEVTKKGEVIEFESEPGFKGVSLLKNDHANETRYDGISNVFFFIFDSNAQVIAHSNLKFWPKVTINKSTLPSSSTLFSYETYQPKGQPFPARIIKYRHNDSNILVYGVSLQSEFELIQKIEFIFLYSFLVFLVLGCIFGYIIAAKGLSGIKRVITSIQEIGKRNLKERINLNNPDTEIKLLASSFNEMAEQIETLVNEMEMVMGNIAHDLRTPLTRMKNVVEIAYLSKDSSQDPKETYEIIMEECDHLSEMIKATLEITKINAGLQVLEKEEIDLQSMIKEVIDLFMPYAEDNNVTMSMQSTNHSCTIQGNKHYLQRLFSNLIDNAIKYNHNPGSIEVLLSSSADQATLRIKDTGIGIDSIDKEKVFHRFYRCDKSRSTAGYGLGLSIAESIVHSHNGSISIESNVPQGTIFTITLPRAGSNL